MNFQNLNKISYYSFTSSIVINHDLSRLIVSRSISTKIEISFTRCDQHHYPPRSLFDHLYIYIYSRNSRVIIRNSQSYHMLELRPFPAPLNNRTTYTTRARYQFHKKASFHLETIRGIRNYWSNFQKCPP